MTNLKSIRKLSLLLVLVILFSTLNAALASPISSEASSSSNNKQQLYQDQVNSIQENTAISDKVKIEKITNTFFTAKEANYKDDIVNIDLSIFLENSNDDNFNIKKILNEFSLEKGIRKGVGAEISSDNLTITINKLNIENNSAKLEVYENYQYQLVGSDAESSRGTTYNIDFTKIDGIWLITKITSNNELESDLMGNDHYDVSSVLNNLLSNDQDALSKESIANEESVLNEKFQVKLNSLSKLLYNGSNAAAYATTYSNSSGSTYDTSPYNSLFANYNPSDCQNFASQCVWYGFGGTNSSTNINSKDFPMIGSGTRAWYQTSTQYDDSLSWINVISFADYVSSSSTSTRGIFGWVNTNNLSYAEVGDTIQIYSSSQGWYHTYVVNAVTGTSGSRTNSNIWVCAHTSNRNNERLDTVIGSSQTNTRNIRINGYYY